MMRHDMDEAEQEKNSTYSGPLALVRRFLHMPEAIVAKSILDSAEIDSYLADERVLGSVYPNLTTGVKLMVRPEDLETAIELLTPPDEESVEGETALEELLRKASLTQSGDEEK